MLSAVLDIEKAQEDITDKMNRKQPFDKEVGRRDEAEGRLRAVLRV